MKSDSNKAIVIRGMMYLLLIVLFLEKHSFSTGRRHRSRCDQVLGEQISES